MSCQMVGLPAQHLHTLRHSGPSDDYLRHVRDLACIKRRGRWMMDASVKRYEKAARSLAQTVKWTAAQSRHYAECERKLVVVLFRGLKAPQPRMGLGRKRK